MPLRDGATAMVYERRINLDNDDREDIQEAREDRQDFVEDQIDERDDD